MIRPACLLPLLFTLLLARLAADPPPALRNAGITQRYDSQVPLDTEFFLETERKPPCGRSSEGPYPADSRLLFLSAALLHDPDRRVESDAHDAAYGGPGI